MRYKRIFYGFMLGFVLLNILLLSVLDKVQHGNSRALSTHGYYADILASPEDYGIQLSHFPCAGGKTACLLLIPQATGEKNHRGNTLRQQLKKRGVTLPAPGHTDALLIMLHGKGSRKEELLNAALRYTAAGFSVVLPDLPNHGENQTALHYAAGADGALVNQIQAEIRQMLPDFPVYLWGISLGTAYANRAVFNRPQQFQGMIIVAGYDDLRRVLGGQIPVPGLRAFLLGYFRLLARGRGLDIGASVPARWAQHIDLPVLQLHGDRDKLIPFALGKQLYQAYRSQDKTWHTVIGAGHNDVFATPEPLFAYTVQWLRRHIDKLPTSPISSKVCRAGIREAERGHIFCQTAPADVP